MTRQPLAPALGSVTGRRAGRPARRPDPRRAQRRSRQPAGRARASPAAQPRPAQRAQARAWPSASPPNPPGAQRGPRERQERAMRPASLRRGQARGRARASARLPVADRAPGPGRGARLAVGIALPGILANGVRAPAAPLRQRAAGGLLRALRPSPWRARTARGAGAGRQGGGARARASATYATRSPRGHHAQPANQPSPYTAPCTLLGTASSHSTPRCVHTCSSVPAPSGAARAVSVASPARRGARRVSGARAGRRARAGGPAWSARGRACVAVGEQLRVAQLRGRAGRQAAALARHARQVRRDGEPARLVAGQIALREQHGEQRAPAGTVVVRVASAAIEVPV